MNTKLIEDIGDLYDSVVRSTENPLVLKLADDMLKIVNRHDKPTPTEDGHAWCPECKETVPAIHITFEEMHDICGQSIIWKDPIVTTPAPLAVEPLATLVKWMDAELHELEIYIQAQEKSPEHIWHKGAKVTTIASLSHTQQRMMEWREKARKFLNGLEDKKESRP